MASLPKAPSANKRPFRMIKGVSSLADLRDGNAVYGYPGDYYGRVYFVNNITGNANFDGLSWNRPFDEVSTAITASEAWRALAAGTTNDYQRNVIYIQGTGTSYSAISALPNYCDMIGIGADPRGDGAGIVVIKGTGADAAAGNARGLGLYNIQFAVSGTADTYCGLDATILLRSVIDNCTFMGSTASTTQQLAGLRVTTSFAGNVIRNCLFGGTNGTHAMGIGMSIGNIVANNNLIENNIFLGIVSGVLIHESANDNGTVIKNNVFSSHLGETQPTTGGITAGAHSILVGNYAVGADAIIGASTTQTLGNVAVATGNGIWETEMA